MEDEYTSEQVNEEHLRRSCGFRNVDEKARNKDFAQYVSRLSRSRWRDANWME